METTAVHSTAAALPVCFSLTASVAGVMHATPSMMMPPSVAPDRLLGLLSTEPLASLPAARLVLSAFDLSSLASLDDRCGGAILPALERYRLTAAQPPAMRATAPTATPAATPMMRPACPDDWPSLVSVATPGLGDGDEPSPLPLPLPVLLLLPPPPLPLPPSPLPLPLPPPLLPLPPPESGDAPTERDALRVCDGRDDRERVGVTDGVRDALPGALFDTDGVTDSEGVIDADADGVRDRVGVSLGTGYSTSPTPSMRTGGALPSLLQYDTKSAAPLALVYWLRASAMRNCISTPDCSAATADAVRSHVSDAEVATHTAAALSSGVAW
jgi:hypothetical protein